MGRGEHLECVGGCDRHIYMTTYQGGRGGKSTQLQGSSGETVKASSGFTPDRGGGIPAHSKSPGTSRVCAGQAAARSQSCAENLILGLLSTPTP